MRNGVQYASTETKRCPMSDPICAAKVAEHLAAMYPATPRACDCPANDTSLTGWLERHNLTAAQIEELLAIWTPEQKAQITRTMTIEHTPTCASNTSDPIDAMEMIEKACGRYTRGKHAGQLRGWASITIVTVGGWMKYGPGERNGRVFYPGTIKGIEITDYNGKPYISVGL